MISEILTTSAFATLSFSSLLGTDEQKSSQKDLIVQAIRTAFPAPSAFVEEPTSGVFTTQPALKHHQLSVKCIQCPSLISAPTLQPGSVFYESKGRSSNEINLHFKSSHADLSSFDWKLVVEVKAIAFGIFAAKNIQRGEIAKATFFKVRPCGQEFRCARNHSFTTFEEAHAKISTLENNEATRGLRLGSRVSFEGFKKPLVVKRGDVVKLTLRTGDNTQSGLTIKSSAKALRNGSIGSQIPVEIIRHWQKGNNRTTVSAKVTGRGEVEYEK